MSAPVLTWYKTFNLTVFIATGLVSRTQTFPLDNIGDVDITITQGNLTSLVFEDVTGKPKMLPINLNEKNPFVFEGYGVYLDGNNDIWIGYPQ